MSVVTYYGRKKFMEAPEMFFPISRAQKKHCHVTERIVGVGAAIKEAGIGVLITTLFKLLLGLCCR